MRYQIDQSGKIEQTNKDTVLCLSNNSWDAVVIKARTKRRLQEFFRRKGQPRNFVIFTFCAGLSILLENNQHINEVMIDIEYPGKDEQVRRILLEMLVDNKKRPEIYFGLIGRQAKAHYRAISISRGRLTGRIVRYDELLDKINKTKMTDERLKT